MKKLEDIPRSDKRNRCNECLGLIPGKPRPSPLRFPDECIECKQNKTTEGVEFKLFKDLRLRRKMI